MTSFRLLGISISLFIFVFSTHSHAINLHPILLSNVSSAEWKIEAFKQFPGQKRIVFLTRYEVKSEHGNLLLANKLYSVNLDGTDFREILSDREAYYTYGSEVVISPDGHHLAFPVYPSHRKSPTQVVVCNEYGDNLHVIDLTPASYSVHSLQFDSQSRNLYFKTDHGFYEEGEFSSNLDYGTIYKLELGSLSVTPISVPLENRRAGELGVYSFKVEEKKIIFQTSGVRGLAQLFSMNLDGTQIHAISAMESGASYQWQTHAGGVGILFSKGDRDLYMANSQEGAGSSLTNGLNVDGFKMGEEGSMFAVAKINLQTEEPSDKLISINHYYHEVYDIPMPSGHVETELYEISPDSKRIVFSSLIKVNGQYSYVLNSYNTRERTVEQLYTRALDHSSQGYGGPRDLEFQSNSQIVFFDTEDSNVHLINLESKAEVVLRTPDNSQHYQSSRNGKHFSFLKGDGIRLIFDGSPVVNDNKHDGLAIVNDKNEYEPIYLGDTKPVIRENYLLDDSGEYLLYLDFENASFGVKLYAAPLAGLKK